MIAPTKVLFLDIDGVLNSGRTAAATGGYPYCFDEANKARFDWIAVGLIRKLCEKEDASIVLSSSWRRGKNAVHECANGLDLPIFDKTLDLPGVRGEEIQDWLNRHPEVTHYAIVDDNSDMLESQKEHFVQTSMEDGLSFSDFAALGRILRGELGGVQRKALIWEDM
jgi:hypothetical protein